MKKVSNNLVIMVVCGLALVFLSMLSADLVHSEPIYRFVDMPTDATIFFTDFDPRTFQSNLTANNITALSPTGNGISNFAATNYNNTIAPFGDDLYQGANTFTFQEPVFAVGLTFFATNYPTTDAPYSFDNNVPDVSHQVRAYDFSDNLIENVFSSSWSIRTGPRSFHIGGGPSFVSSYAGIWTDVPIYKVSFGGISPSNGALVAAYGSFAFSKTPNPITEPVEIDIKPGSDPNSINCDNENGVITVAILSTDGFDATTVVHATVIFEGASEAHEDKKSGEPKRHEEDVDGDGDIDLVFHFRLGDTDLTCESTEGTLTGETFDGMPIEGTDSIAAAGEEPYECYAAVAQTGQTTCWDTDGAVIPCAGTGQDGELQKGFECPEPRFTDNGNGTVTDNCTGLIWLKDANCFATRTWSEALSDSITLGDGPCGLTDGSSAGNWRLPNTRELLSLNDFSRYNPALPAGHPFINVVFGHYWSSTTYAPEPYTDQAWRTCMHCGHQQPDNKTDHHYVWPVRGGN